MTNSSNPPMTRARLLSLLSEACELEHGLACSYLFTAFSIKREIAEGLDWREQQNCRRWASQIFHVAAQEMLHLAQAWNLLTAVGGTPYYYRPNLPCPAKHYPFNAAILLRRFDLETMERFVYFETPDNQDSKHHNAPLPAGSLWPIDETFPFSSVGELYGECLKIIEHLDPNTLFVRNADLQVDQGLIDFPEIVQVQDVESARAAIEMITEQGEGNVTNRKDSHYGIFVSIADEIRHLAQYGAEFSRPVGDNPYVKFRRDQMSALHPDFQKSHLTMTEVRDGIAVSAMDLFDDVYISMLQAMAYVFSNATNQRSVLQQFAESSLQLMTTVIKPLGEAVCLLPSGTDGLNAGPAFAFSRHTMLPTPPVAAQLVYHERLCELSEHAATLQEKVKNCSPLAQSQIHSAASNLHRLAKSKFGR